MNNSDDVSFSSIGDNIKKYRTKLGITQDELSDRAGIAYSTVAKLEQGSIKNPSLTTIMSISSALGVEITQLFKTKVTKLNTVKSSDIKFIYLDVNGVILRFFQRAFIEISRKSHQPIDKTYMITNENMSSFCGKEFMM